MIRKGFIEKVILKRLFEVREGFSLLNIWGKCDLDIEIVSVEIKSWEKFNEYLGNKFVKRK